jgi:hypothetical protein
MVPEIYVQFHCVMINLINFKHNVQNEIGLDISISKLNFVKLFFKFVKSHLPSCSFSVRYFEVKLMLRVFYFILKL